MRKLKADEIECRVAQVTAKGCSLLLYKTARVDRAILDEEFGQFGWQNDFKVIDGKMYGGIGIYSNDLGEWLWRWDCGVESNTEAEKGQASDCFKRAGFKWGIGVELYTAPFIFINGTSEKDEHNSTPQKTVYKLKDKYIKYEVKEIGYSDKGDINKLVINDSNGNKVFELGKYVKPQETPKKKEQPKEVLTEDDKQLILCASECETTKALEDFYKEVAPMMSCNKAKSELIKECKKRKGELTNGQ